MKIKEVHEFFLSVLNYCNIIEKFNSNKENNKSMYQSLSQWKRNNVYIQLHFFDNMQ